MGRYVSNIAWAIIILKKTPKKPKNNPPRKTTHTQKNPQTLLFSRNLNLTGHPVHLLNLTTLNGQYRISEPVSLSVFKNKNKKKRAGDKSTFLEGLSWRLSACV